MGLGNLIFLALLVAASGLFARNILRIRRNILLGRDVSIIIHDDELSYLRNGDDVPVYTATRSSVREAGRQTAEMLLDLIANPGQPPQTRLLEAELIIGQSTGPAPNRT